MDTLCETRPAAGPPCIAHHISTDAAEHGRALQGWHLELHQVSAGRFHGDLTQIALANLQICRERTNRTLLKRGSARPGSVVLSLPLAASGPGLSAGRHLDFPTLLFAEGSDLPELITPEQLDLFCIAFDQEWLAERVAALGFPRLGDRSWRYGTITLPEHAHKRLRALLASVFDIRSHSPAMLHYPTCMSALEDDIATGILNALGTASVATLSEDMPQQRVADTARTLIMEDAWEPLSISSVCERMGVSRRYLQNCFLATYGISATQLLRRLRLNHARQDLRRSTLEGHTVSIGDIAARWGFWHWSRFAADYKRHFAELPSQTVRNALRETGAEFRAEIG